MRKPRRRDPNSASILAAADAVHVFTQAFATWRQAYTRFCVPSGVASLVESGTALHAGHALHQAYRDLHYAFHALQESRILPTKPLAGGTAHAERETTYPYRLKED